MKAREIDVKTLLGNPFFIVEEQIKKAEASYGKTVELTDDFARKHALVFDFNTAANIHLPKSEIKTFNEIVNSLWNDYKLLNDALLKSYQEEVAVQFAKLYNNSQKE